MVKENIPVTVRCASDKDLIRWIIRNEVGELNDSETWLSNYRSEFEARGNKFQAQYYKQFLKYMLKNDDARAQAEKLLTTRLYNNAIQTVVGEKNPELIFEYARIFINLHFNDLIDDKNFENALSKFSKAVAAYGTVEDNVNYSIEFQDVNAFANIERVIASKNMQSIIMCICDTKVSQMQLKACDEVFKKCKSKSLLEQYAHAHKLAQSRISKKSTKTLANSDLMC